MKYIEETRVNGEFVIFSMIYAAFSTFISLMHIPSRCVKSLDAALNLNNDIIIAEIDILNGNIIDNL